MRRQHFLVNPSRQSLHPAGSRPDVLNASPTSMQREETCGTPTTVAGQEPRQFSTADVGAIVEIHELINRLADDGRAVVVISSYLPEIMALSDRILVSRQGKVVEEFSASEEKIMYAAIH